MVGSYARRFVIARWVAALFGVVAMVWGSLASVSAAPQTVSALPFVNNFATARFKVLVTNKVGNEKSTAYGNGEVVPPDRSRVWITDGTEMFTEVIQIGRKMYNRSNEHDWEEGGSGSLIDQALPVSAQFNVIQKVASKIYYMGDAMVGSTPTKHYQVWITGKRLLEMMGGGEDLSKDERAFFDRLSYKFDFWVSTTDEFLYQQNTELIYTPAKNDDLPNLTFAYLVTFSDINDPTVSVNAPISE